MLNTYRILYTWQGRNYQTTMQHRNAAQAFFAAEIMIQPGAKAYAILPVR